MIFLNACGGNNKDDNNNGKSPHIFLNSDLILISIGEKKDLGVWVEANDSLFDGEELQYNSYNAFIADVDIYGEITGIAIGYTIVNIIYEEVDTFVNVYITEHPVADIQIDPPDIYLLEGDTVSLGLDLVDNTGNILIDPGVPVNWTIRNTNIATISENGLITAIYQGVTDVGATIKDYSDSAQLTVIAVPPPP